MYSRITDSSRPTVETKYPGPRSVAPRSCASFLHTLAPNESHSCLDEPHHLRDCILRWDRQQHVHVVGHQMPFLYLTLLLRCQSPEYLTKVATKLYIASSSNIWG